MQSLSDTARAEMGSAPLRGINTGRNLDYAESATDRLRRIALGFAWAVKPPRFKGVPATLVTLGAHYAGFGLKAGELPNPEKALRDPDGLAGIAEDLNVETLLAAYARGLFPFCHVEPMKWWAPAQRMVLLPHEFHIEKNLRRRLRQQHFRATFDTAFEAVMRGCAEARPGRWRLTWITPRVLRAYVALHQAGHAHSVEVWDQRGALVGGAYGVAVGRAFFTESQFTRERDASKVGFTILNHHLQHWGFRVNDGKHHTGHLAQLGFKLMPRSEFNALLSRACAEPGRTGCWHVDDKLDVTGWEPGAKRPV